MNTETETIANPLMRSVKMYGGAALIAAAAIIGVGVLIHETTPNPVEQTGIQKSANLPGGEAPIKDVNFIRAHSGYNETCAAEIWVVPANFKSVSDFLTSNRDAQPDLKRIVAPSERSTCAANANLGPYELSTYYSKSTIEIQEPEA